MKYLVLFVALVFASGQALAQTQAQVSVANDSLYRGQSISDGASVQLNLKVDDILVDGFYTRATLDSIELTPLNSTARFKSDFGVGYAFDLGGINTDVSLNRVVNPVIYSGDFSEARLVVGGTPFKSLRTYGFVEYMIGDSTDRLTYYGFGSDYTVADLTLGFKSGAVHYRDIGHSRYLNTDVFARYNVWRTMDVFGQYSFGHRDQNKNGLDNVWMIGAAYSFR